MTNVYQEVLAERLRAHAKHGGDGNGMESDTMSYGRRLAVIGEEYGEACKALLEDGIGPEMHAELVQLAAMACATADAITRVLSTATGVSSPDAQAERIVRGAAGPAAVFHTTDSSALAQQGAGRRLRTNPLIVEPATPTVRVRSLVLGTVWECVAADSGAAGETTWRNSVGSSLSWQELKRQYGPLELLESADSKPGAFWRRAFTSANGWNIGPVIEADEAGLCAAHECRNAGMRSFSVGSLIRIVENNPWHVLCAETLR